MYNSVISKTTWSGTRVALFLRQLRQPKGATTLIPHPTAKRSDAMPTGDDALMQLLLSDRCEVLLSGGRHVPEWVTLGVNKVS
jgi:hypothetical protein